jgi:hypothetical protein
MRTRTCCCLITCFLLVSKVFATESNSKQEEGKTLTDANQPHSRQKRLIWITDDGRLALPPGTSLIIAPTLSMPFVRYPPDGFHSNISISIPLTIDFDKLGNNKFYILKLIGKINLNFQKGLTDNQNPLGTLGPLLARSMSQSVGEQLADYVYKHLKNSRRKRDTNEINSETPKLPYENAFHGGERAILYGVVEDFLSNFGLDGKGELIFFIIFENY